MPNTSLGFPYPDPTEPVAEGAADIQALADALDTFLKRTITGRVSGAGAILAGTGFTVVRVSAGSYTVTFTTAFAAIPVVVGETTEQAGGNRHLSISAITVNGFSVVTGATAGTGADLAFNFVAMVAR